MTSTKKRNASADGYHSRERQDRWVLESVLDHKRGGYFVELGALDGVFNSNTLAMERDYGWSGICIEANPRQFLKLLTNRGCHKILTCVDSERRLNEFRLDWVFSGILAEDTDQNRIGRGPGIERAEKGGGIFTTPSVTLTEILDYFDAPSEIDYFSLDVEGSEERVLRGLDLQRYRFGCLTIERPSIWINRALAENGYRFVKLLWEDACYVHEDQSPDGNGEESSWPAWELRDGKKRRVRAAG